ncbi:hypothetical protein [Pseudomonas fluorescens]|uniref:hypothetical protein n=1 Tax=Pseudomonas fluorescens TaxID=294 RepID=UPI001780A8D0|nr:hypothetical protein [Pseudomonas fluorescens]
MSNNDGPGFIDRNYGKEGVAAIPAQEPWNPDVDTLQVFPAACAPDGSMAFYGYNPLDDVDRAHGLFTRLKADGQWDSATGHVPVSTGQSGPLPTRVYDFTSMIHAQVDGEASYLTASRVWYEDDPEILYLHVAIGRYQAEDFKPVVGFGDDGIALPEPPRSTRGHSKRTAIPKLPAWTERQGPEFNAVDYRDTPKLGVIDGTIRVIFGGYCSDDTTRRNTWCALLDAKTGKPVSGLGPESKDSQYRLSLIDDESTTLYQAEFLSDGRFLLLSSTESGMYVHRFLANALPDETFANGRGYIELPGSGIKAGMAVNNERIVISRGGQITPIGQSAELYCYTLDGEVDNDFSCPSLSVEGHSLTLDRLSFDSQGRLVLAGQIYYPDGPRILSKMQVVRLLSTGKPDLTFGQGGYSPANYYQLASNGLYLDDQGIRVLTLMPSERVYEHMVKLYS